MKHDIRIIAVGGTIDAKQYDFTEGKVISFGNPAVQKILRTGRVRHISWEATPIDKNDDADILVLDQKDSLDMSDSDRKHILRLCKNDTRNRILITHGTDTMTDTGLLLSKNIKNKTIVLTGAMKPYASKNSDAAFNLGGALVAVETLPHGIYVVMQGEVFPIEKVKKVREPNDPHFEETKSVKSIKSIKSVKSRAS